MRPTRERERAAARSEAPVAGSLSRACGASYSSARVSATAWATEKLRACNVVRATWDESAPARLIRFRVAATPSPVERLLRDHAALGRRLAAEARRAARVRCRARAAAAQVSPLKPGQVGRQAVRGQKCGMDGGALQDDTRARGRARGGAPAGGGTAAAASPRPPRRPHPPRRRPSAPSRPACDVSAPATLTNYKRAPITTHRTP